MSGTVDRAPGPVLIALIVGAGAALLQLVAQVTLATMSTSGSTREAIAANPSSWIVSHVFIALAVLGYAAAVLLIAMAHRPAVAGGALLMVRRVLAGVAVLLTLTGLIVQGAVLGIDAVIGALATATLEGGAAAASEVHRLIGEQAVPLFDALDGGLTIALMLAALIVLIDRRVPALAPVALVVGLAVPGFTELRIVAPATVALAFMIALVVVVRDAHGQGDSSPRSQRVPLPAVIVMVLAVIPAAALSAERLVLAIVVMVALAAILAADRADRRASGAPMRTASTES